MRDGGTLEYSAPVFPHSKSLDLGIGEGGAAAGLRGPEICSVFPWNHPKSVPWMWLRGLTAVGIHLCRWNLFPPFPHLILLGSLPLLDVDFPSSDELTPLCFPRFWGK